MNHILDDCDCQLEFESKSRKSKISDVEIRSVNVTAEKGDYICMEIEQANDLVNWLVDTWDLKWKRT